MFNIYIYIFFGYICSLYAKRLSLTFCFQLSVQSEKKSWSYEQNIQPKLTNLLTKTHPLIYSPFDKSIKESNIKINSTLQFSICVYKYLMIGFNRQTGHLILCCKIWMNSAQKNTMDQYREIMCRKKERFEVIICSLWVKPIVWKKSCWTKW